jgi:hypothetical protein
MGPDQFLDPLFARIEGGGDILSPPAELAALAFEALKAGD